ncbi:hypothetical protein [Catalinimonas niigatensis]|uniref:hypothetical protein n=1 Tax=Catalinimonas niigatensis TaxID=1397264 RepID=UPI0026664911|nr:hypothetical protein [Catalinimonas niigatensis]WPP51436.1 hypothetical protein PZB72_03420 [Catalinimonas niigatensis]
MNTEQQCYMCNREATSREHVPPLCLFPEMKDSKGINFRKDLITVPSCDLHNSKKSDDDEFLMLSLSGLLKNNPVGNFHQLTKANRAIKRKNKDFIEKEILRNHRYGKIQTTDGKFRIISLGNPNIERLSKCLKHIAYGLFYQEFKERFNGELRMILEFIEYSDDNIQTMKNFLKRRFELEKVLNSELKGNNPEVFYYQFHKPDEFGLIGLKIVFYGTAEAYFSFMEKSSKEPFNLGMKLIEGGMNTFIKLGEEKFELNKKNNVNKA